MQEKVDIDEENLKPEATKVDRKTQRLRSRKIKKVPLRMFVIKLKSKSKPSSDVPA